MTQDMKKDTILHTEKGTYVHRLINICSSAHEHMFIGSRTYVHNQSKQIVRPGRTGSPLEADWESAWGGLRNSLTLLRSLLLLVILTLGPTTAWGQTGTNHSGIFYFANGGSGKSGDPAITGGTSSDNYFYLVPADNPQQGNKRDAWYSSDYSAADGDREKPYITTYKTKKDAAEIPSGVTERPHNSVWIVKFASTDSGTDYYYLIHAATGKYVVYEPPYSNNWNRKSVHLLTTDSPGENAKFEITTNQITINSINYDCYNFRPKSRTSGNRYLNAANANTNYYYSSENNSDGAADYFRGLVGLWSAVGGGSDWKPEATLLDAPTISAVDANNKVTITDANSLPSGYEIRYTTDGSTEPTASTGEVYSGPISITASVTIKAVVVRYGMVLTEVASEAREPVPCATPVISFDYTTSEVSITCATDGSTIKFSTDGGEPTTDYDGPFSISGPTTVKAIATRATFAPSAVAELAISQVATPTIQNNGSNAISITTTTSDATIYYTTDGSTPTTSSTEYTDPLTENVSNVTIKAIAVKENMITSAVGSGKVKLQCATPVITRDGMTFTLSCSFPTGANLYYKLNGGSEVAYDGTPVSFMAQQLPITVTAVARHSNYTESETASFELINGSGTSDDPYLIYSATDLATFVANVNNGTTASKCYKLEIDVSGSGIDAITTDFTGTFDGGLHTISNLGHALFNTVDGGVVKNVILDNVKITSGTNVGAICNEATGASRIYNCGILATSSTMEKDEDGYDHISSCSSSISGSGYVGGIVGLLDGSSRVINCFSYANVSGGSYVGGIVGYNNVASTNPATELKTMVMNCMFYGEVSGSSIAPIYNGNIITNIDNNKGVGNYNYFRLEASYVQPTGITYNCALGAEDRYLQRFEFFRNLLNSHRELAGWWATGTYSSSEMMKWVLEPSQLGTSTPYPILKVPGKYLSVVNIDAENAPLALERNKGGKLGTLSVTIRGTGGGAVYSAPDGASISTGSLTLNITDKDPDHFNFNYYKVQLPYYNDVGTGNYTGNRVVTGWKIVGITGGTPGEFKKEDTDKGYNFADRNCTNKDLYSVSGRVFNQGAYWDVPEGVTDITIEPYWAKCVYLADQNADKVYNTEMTTGYDVPYVGGGQKYTNGNSYSIAGENQVVFTAIGDAIASSGTGTALFQGVNNFANHTVYDYAVVLVGNYHHYYNQNIDKSKPYTVTSIDLDGDNEPDYSYILRYNGRCETHPVRADFINIPGLGMAQKSTGGTGSYNFGIMIPTGWFESTNTSLFRFTQFEYEHSSRSATDAIIVQGGVIEQWVSYNQKGRSNNIPYIHVGGNVWFKEFHTGCHQDKNITTGFQPTKHSPISVTGGDFDEFYLTGLYVANVGLNNYADNAECYINGGRFGTVCGAAMEGIGKANGADNTGNITWLIQNADIHEFYAGGLNAAKPVTGNLSTTIVDSHVDIFCGGPKFGDMSANKTVVTNATGCTFGTFFGAGYGGNSYSRDAPRNHNNIVNFPHNDGEGAGNHASWNAWLADKYKKNYDAAKGGISTQFDYQFLPMSNNTNNVARIFVDYVAFSLATTHDVTSSLEDCTITGNFYGGGSLGKVEGDVTSTLTNCTVNGSVFGAGYSASLPTVEVMGDGFQTEPYYYTDLGTYRQGVFPATTTYHWEQATATEFSSKQVDNEAHILYTTADLTALGTVAGTATLTIDGTTTVVGESVYGGGEESSVNGNTVVAVNDGTIGVIPAGQTGGATYGNVYGGGKGKYKEIKDVNGVETEVELAGDKAVVLGLVKGNTNVTINGGSIMHNVYGGGAYGSVGTYTYDTSGNISAYTSGGAANVTIKGGTIGTTGKDNGMVFGSSRGDIDALGAIHDRLAWVYNTNVIIGTSATGTYGEEGYVAESGPTIKGSVYGSGENGHTYTDANVTVHGGIIGIPSGDNEVVQGVTYAAYNYPSRGNVYGGGCGTDKYYSSSSLITGTHTANDGMGDMYNPLAGIVLGTATVLIDGGQVVHNVYGAGAMGSVGTMEKNTTTNDITITNGGTTNVTISGGTVGVTVTVDETHPEPTGGNVFGAARGDANNTQTDVALVKTTNVTISQAEGKTTTIYGNVYGGGECGDVGTYHTVTEEGNDKGNNNYLGGETSGVCVVNMTGGTVNGHVFGAGKGDYSTYECKKAMAKSATVTITNGAVGGNVYGGGEVGRVEKNTIVEIGDGEGAETGGTSTPVITGNVFGAGKGVDTHGYSALVRGNSSVTIEGNAKVGMNVYGGGQIATVGKYWVSKFLPEPGNPAPDGMPDGMPYKTRDGGVCTVIVQGYAQIGPDGEATATETAGHVFGAGKGVTPNYQSGVSHRMDNNNQPDVFDSADEYYEFLETLALASLTSVTIDGHATVKGSVYGGSENGFVQDDTNVEINDNLMIGTPGTTTYGKIYGGGKGYPGFDAAGRVGRSTIVNVNNGTMHGSVYGGGELGIVKGAVIVNINGGEIKKDVYGGGALANTNTNNWNGSTLSETYVEVSGLTVEESSVVGYYTESNGTYTEATGEAVANTKYYRKVNTTVNLLGGLINGDAYGGGLGRLAVGPQAAVYYTQAEADAYNQEHSLSSGDEGFVTTASIKTPAVEGLEAIPAKVYGDVLVDLNGTTTSTETNTGTPKNRNTKGCVVNEVFGCNNINGSPKGNVTVHVYGTQHGATSMTKIVDKYTPPYYDRDKGTSEGLKAYLGRLITQANAVPVRSGTEDNGISASVITDANTLLNTTLAEVAEADLTDEQKASLQEKIDAVLAELDGLYDVHAVYGGGNNAAYEPTIPYHPTTAATGSKSQVIIEGCDYTSIQFVYGGGNAAPVPETNILIKGTKMIDYLFGGGNGTRVHANVGYLGDNTTSQGTGNVTMQLRGGKIHNLFGGSNSNGNIRGNVSRRTLTATEMPAGEYGDCCATLEINRIYSAGKNADIDGDQIDVLDCMSGSWVDEYYGGAENANVKGNVELTITGGYFRKVFGGNKTSGAIFGHIKLNIEETANCNPIVIDELYGCGNDAPYSVYGYKQTGTDENNKPIYAIRTSSSDGDPVHFGDGGEDDHTMPPYDNPEVNIISCTRIGQVYGGGYGSNAVVYGNPTVNIDMIQGSFVGSLTGTSKLGEIGGSYTDASSQEVEGGVFGGGNAADVYGDATVNIGTKTTVKLHQKAADGVISMGNDNPVLGANIAGNVFGGGNLANVTGNTYVNICAVKDDNNTTADVIEYSAVSLGSGTGVEGVVIKGDVFGGGKGVTENANVTGAFECAKAMVGVVNSNDGSIDIMHEVTGDGTSKGTRVSIGNGTIDGTVYGGGEVGRVEWNGVVTIGLPVGSDETSQPQITGSVFGGGKGVEQYGYAALMRGNTFVTVQGNAKVGKSVYGGGEIASVGKYQIASEDNIKDDDFMAAHPGIEVGMPYSLGNEKSGYCTVIVRGNAEIGPDNMQMTKAGGPDDEGHVFGGGKGILPYENENTFKCQASGHNGAKHPGRMSKGNQWQCYYNEADPDDDSAYLRFIETQALATHTEVLIDENAFVKGSVYGGSLSGHVQHDTHVTITGDCQIGAGEDINERYTDHYSVTEWPTDTKDITTSWAECAHWTFDAASMPYDPYAKYSKTVNGKVRYYYDAECTEANYANGGSSVATDGHTYYGNVFGGGSGVIPYKPGKWHREAGTVGGNTVVDITGGHILTSVYGGNEHTDVGTYDPTTRALVAGTGKCTINMTGGTVGVPRIKDDIAAHPVTCYVFGAGKGDPRVSFNEWTNVGETQVNISGNARIYGSTFGGGEDGHVLGDAETNIGGSVDLNGDGDKTDAGETFTDPSLIIGTHGLSGADGNIFGGGRGFSEEALTAGVVSGNVRVNIHNGKMLGSIFGGGRLASVGTHLAAEGTTNYGKLIPDGKNQVIGDDDEDAPGATHGHIAINIDGGTIGATDGNGKLLTSSSSIGDVFGGCKGSGNNKHFGLAKKTIITMEGGTVNGNVYGGGELGYVGEATYNSTSKLYEWNEESVNGGLCTINISGTSSVKGDVYGAGKGLADDFDCEKALVRATSVTISAGTVGGNVYGGGEVGRVDQNTKVTLGEESGTSGGTDAVIVGDVFGAGAGLETHGYSALVRGNTEVTIQGNASVGHSVYGGGEIASVGRYALNSSDMPETLKGGGKCTVTVKGNAVIGSSGEGYVFGAGMGINPFDAAHNTLNYTDATVSTGKPKRMTRYNSTDYLSASMINAETGKATGTTSKNTIWEYSKGSNEFIWEYYTTQEGYFDFLQTLALATDTEVSIEGSATVHGSVYGGSESGFVQRETDVKIKGGEILTITDTDSNPTEGNVFGGGKGLSGFDMAGRVRGNATTAISGSSTINGNVYGGGALGFVGKFTEGSDTYGTIYNWPVIETQTEGQTQTTGLCTVTISGSSRVAGNVFGAGKGEAKTFECLPAMTRTTSVTISAGTVGGNVYGGGEVSRVDQNTVVTIGEGTGASGVTAVPTITGSVFGAGAGKETHGYSALVRGNATVTIQGNAKVGQSVYGGGEIAAVGRYSLDGSGMPSGLVSGGECNVTVKGYAKIGPETGGNVFGAGMGVNPSDATHNFDYTDATVSTGKPKRMTRYTDATAYPSTAMISATSTPTTTTSKKTIWEYCEGSSEFIWEYFTTQNGYLDFLQTLALATDTKVSIEGNATVNGSVYGGSESGFVQRWTDVKIKDQCEIGSNSTVGNIFGGGLGISNNEVAGRVRGNTTVTIIGGTTHGDVYGGGALGKVNTWTTTEGTPAVTTYPTATVNLLGGTITGDAFGGGRGDATTAADAGNTIVNLNGIDKSFYDAADATMKTVFDGLISKKDGVLAYPLKTDLTGCIVNRIFGANNVNGTPKGHVKVHVFATQNSSASLPHIENKSLSDNVYDMTAVFGGGKQANYVPAATDNTEVIIDGCNLTSIETVYGGGFGASVPGTDVLITGTEIINEVFGGGYGKKDDEFPGNPGADVVNNTVIQLLAGKVNAIYGGSNTQGNIGGKSSITTLTTDDMGQTINACDKLDVGELYGGGKSAPMDGGAEIVLRCMPDSWIGDVYGGAREANVGSVDHDVSLTITSGKFERVFGGNKSSGEIRGYVEVNIEECPTCNTPIIIGELYGAGNEAEYDLDTEAYGQDYPSPRVNVRAFTSIGAIYGGGYGESAKVKGNPTVYVNVGMVDGGGQDYNPDNDTNKPSSVKLYAHEKNKIGVIGDVFGGGNAAEVDGSTNVFIGTEKFVKLDRIVAGETNVSNYYIRTGTSPNYDYNAVPRTKATEAGTYYQREQTGSYTPVDVNAGDDISNYYIRSGEDPAYVYTPVSAAEDGKVYCLPVIGADIQGNVYGGGNAAKVTGNTNVVIGKEVTD